MSATTTSPEKGAATTAIRMKKAGIPKKKAQPPMRIHPDQGIK